MTYNATVEPILRGTGIFATFWVVLSILVTIVISTCTKKDTAADRCGHVQTGLVGAGLTAFCCYLMWVCTFLHQWRPLIAPTLD
mmetsp:Transcript_27/g.76  ORF Transcript_27/g.76 Transcript_27/m.76 type:complete len:84 (+) Transcript_27:54-305(+)